MSNSSDEYIVSSKKVLGETGISRATLNNYIRMGIIPRPVVQKPIDGSSTTKKIGYFPVSVIGRIETVKNLKKQGKSLEDIIKLLVELPHESSDEKTTILSDEAQNIPTEGETRKKPNRFKEELQLTLEEISYPSYLLNYDFDIEWINHRAENRILNQSILLSDSVEKKNIFKMFFNWEFQSNVKNWKDLVSFHMSFAKLKFSKTWLSKLYKGITHNETRVLENIYDEVIASTEKTINDTVINILIKGGTTERYRIYTVFFKEGILFVYSPSDRYY